MLLKSHDIFKSKVKNREDSEGSWFDCEFISLINMQSVIFTGEHFFQPCYYMQKKKKSDQGNKNKLIA